MKAWCFAGPLYIKNGTRRTHLTAHATGSYFRPCQDPLDALQWATGTTLYRVELGGVIEKREEFIAATQRTIIERWDATSLLRYFARMQALSVIDLWEPPDAVLDFLMTGNQPLIARVLKEVPVEARPSSSDVALLTLHAARNEAITSTRMCINADHTGAFNAVRHTAWARTWSGDGPWSHIWAEIRADFRQLVLSPTGGD